mmetsp:Transcript_75970/g.216796  ORF Transcript_75970/g.216796 Transcript_75970/m.216796 type:complete len:100 (+) Transcript_75970:1229-1528(+)
MGSRRKVIGWGRALSLPMPLRMPFSMETSNSPETMPQPPALFFSPVGSTYTNDREVRHEVTLAAKRRSAHAPLHLVGIRGPNFAVLVLHSLCDGCQLKV